jgi:hypothetical protein
MENNPHFTPVKYERAPWLKAFRTVMYILAVILTIILVAIGIGWLSTLAAVLVSDTAFGYTAFFGLEPLVVAVIITASLYLAYWPISLLCRACWSLAKGVNRFEKHHLITGAIIFSLSIASLIVIAIEFTKDISINYKDENLQVIIDEGNVCISDTNKCE